jgi:kynurenine formamidase
MTEVQLMSEDEMLTMFDTLSNKGRWGADDELGTLNYITPEKVIAASRLVQTGRILSIGHDVGLVPSRKNPRPAVHRMLHVGPELGALDQITIVPHGYQETHLDALGHQFYDGALYNERTVRECVSRTGLKACSIHATREGIVTRGVLLDIAHVRGVPWLRPDEHVSLGDLKAAEELVDGGVQCGDAVFVRIGLGAREAVEGPEDFTKRAGLMPECIRWIHEKEVAVYSGDCFEKVPLPYERCRMPLHQIGCVAMGLYMLDHAAMEPLAVVCAEEGRRDFMVAIGPLRIPGGTGSPVNPICVF